jgi:hypothetical protein
MNNVPGHFIVILTLVSFCFFGGSLLAMDEEQSRITPSTSIRSTVSSTEQTGVLERLRQLSLRPMPTSTILNERLLTTPDQHVQFLKEALRASYERVVIVSPYISIYRLRENDDGDFYTYPGLIPFNAH